MTYNVFRGTLSLTQSIYSQCCFELIWCLMLTVTVAAHVGVVSHGGNDGSGLCNDCWNQPVLVRFYRCSQSGGEDCYDIPAVLGTVEFTVSLRLRHESCQERSVCCWEYQAEVSRWRRKHTGNLWHTRISNLKQFDLCDANFSDKVIDFMKHILQVG